MDTPTFAREGSQYDALRYLLLCEYGVDIRHSDQALLDRKLRDYCDIHRLASFGECVEFIERNPAERERLGDVVYSHTTSFNRSPDQFAFMLETLTASARWRRSRGPVVCSFACSTGEEAYTIAIYLMEHGHASGGATFRVIGADCSPSALRVARRGRYAEAEVQRLRPIAYERYFIPDTPGRLRVGRTIRERVRFTQLNLLTSPYRLRTSVDIAFLQNALEYHTAANSVTILTKIRAVLEEGGYLISDADLPLSRNAVESCGYASAGAGRYRAVHPGLRSPQAVRHTRR